MRIKVQITLESGEGESEMVEVARLARGPLRPDTLGLSLAEARAILAGLEQTLAERQTAEFVAQAQRCSRCGRDRTCKGHHRIVVRTPFGVFCISPQKGSIQDHAVKGASVPIRISANFPNDFVLRLDPSSTV